jgi:hypothetical protein
LPQSENLETYGVEKAKELKAITDIDSSTAGFIFRWKKKKATENICSGFFKSLNKYYLT